MRHASFLVNSFTVYSIALRSRSVLSDYNMSCDDVSSKQFQELAYTAAACMLRMWCTNVVFCPLLPTGHVNCMGSLSLTQVL